MCIYLYMYIPKGNIGHASIYIYIHIHAGGGRLPRAPGSWRSVGAARKCVATVLSVEFGQV